MRIAVTASRKLLQKEHCELSVGKNPFLKGTALKVSFL